MGLATMCSTVHVLHTALWMNLGSLPSTDSSLERREKERGVWNISVAHTRLKSHPGAGPEGPRPPWVYEPNCGQFDFPKAVTLFPFSCLTSHSFHAHLTLPHHIHIVERVSRSKTVKLKDSRQIPGSHRRVLKVRHVGEVIMVKPLG